MVEKKKTSLQIKWWMWIPQSIISIIAIVISLMQLLK